MGTFTETLAPSYPFKGIFPYGILPEHITLASSIAYSKAKTNNNSNNKREA